VELAAHFHVPYPAFAYHAFALGFAAVVESTADVAAVLAWLCEAAELTSHRLEQRRMPPA